MNVIESLLADAATITALRREIHSYPELCFQEQRTSDLVAAKLTEWGIPIRRGLGKTSVVGIIEGRRGTAGGAIGLRADMDALPMAESNTFAHASRHAGRMHACGHDGHTAMLLAAAQHLAKHRDFDGIVYLLFQPAEEGGGGAREMIKDGCSPSSRWTPSSACTTGPASRSASSPCAPAPAWRRATSSSSRSAAADRTPRCRTCP